MPEQVLIPKSRTVINRFVRPDPAVLTLVYTDGSPNVTIPTYPRTDYYPISGVQETCWSVSHKRPKRGSKNNLGDYGGPFKLKRFEFLQPVCEESFGTRNVTEAGYPYYYKVDDSKYKMPIIYSAPFAFPRLYGNPGEIQKEYDSFDFPSTPLENYGPGAIRKFSPLKPGSQLGGALGELLNDGLPNLPFKTIRDLLKSYPDSSVKRALNLGPAAGKEYLNYKFGYLPLLNDIRSIYHTWQKLDTMIKQVIRNNGRPVRRRGRIDLSSTSSSDDWSSIGFNQLDTTGHTTLWLDQDLTTSMSRQTNIREDIWFSGSFRYYLPPELLEDKWSAKAKLALFSDPLPSTLYQLLPWSWLLDWFSNVGDVISLYSSQYLGELGPIYLDYGYLMRHRVKTETYKITMPGIYRLPVIAGSGSPEITYPRKYSGFLKYETMERVAATPFGFGLELSSLSLDQLKILTALGLSRSNFR